MNKREAKRYACRVLGLLAEHHIDNGSGFIYEDDEVSSEGDVARVEEALRDLADELRRRGET